MLAITELTVGGTQCMLQKVKQYVLDCYILKWNPPPPKCLKTWIYFKCSLLLNSVINRERSQQDWIRKIYNMQIMQEFPTNKPNLTLKNTENLNKATYIALFLCIVFINNISLYFNCFIFVQHFISGFWAYSEC